MSYVPDEIFRQAAIEYRAWAEKHGFSKAVTSVSRETSDAYRKASPEACEKAQKKREAIRKECPTECGMGQKAGVNNDPGYPANFDKWPPQARNAWFAGFGIGRVDRLKAKP